MASIDILKSRLPKDMAIKDIEEKGNRYRFWFYHALSDGEKPTCPGNHAEIPKIYDDEIASDIADMLILLEMAQFSAQTGKYSKINTYLRAANELTKKWRLPGPGLISGT